MVDIDTPIFVAGHRGMVGSSIVRQLEQQGYTNIIVRTRQDLDLVNQKAVQDFFNMNEIQQVYLSAAKVGGIHANNTFPADFIYENLMIQTNIVQAAYQTGVQKLLFLGSSCIYPKYTEQPMSEDSLLTGILEPTNEPYAIAKIAGLKLCESYNRQYGVDYRSVMPTNLYGPNDNFHPENSHVVPALIRRFYEAVLKKQKTVTVWGSGKPMREFMHVYDMAEASIFVMNLDEAVYQQHTEPMLSHINVGTGIDLTIGELVTQIVEVSGFNGDVVFDTSKPDGTPRKLMDISRLEKLGFSPKTSIETGLQETYRWFIDNYSRISSENR